MKKKIRDIASCGKCAIRDWCAIFLISVHRRVDRLLDKHNQDIEMALQDAKEIYNESCEYSDSGVIDYLEHLRDDSLSEKVDIDTGRDHLKDQLHTMTDLTKMQGLIVMEEKREAENA